MEKIPGGYFIKARCIKNSWISHAPPIVREVWDYLLREANHDDVKYNGFVVKRGQLFRSYRQIRDDLSWRAGYRIMRYHESSMKRGMNALMKERMIELTSEPRGNLITVLNYDFYQDPSNYGRTNGQTNERTNGEPMANRQRSAINKNEKNLRIKDKRLCSESKTDSTSEPSILSIPLTPKHGLYPITQAQIESWQSDYPGISVHQELVKLKNWNQANPTRRKTKVGIQRHIVSWLSKAQDSAGRARIESIPVTPDIYVKRYGDE